jgi:hypothetical protein
VIDTGSSKIDFGFCFFSSDSLEMQRSSRQGDREQSPCQALPAAVALTRRARYLDSGDWGAPSKVSITKRVEDRQALDADFILGSHKLQALSWIRAMTN